jgi:hypothetical protein
MSAPADAAYVAWVDAVHQLGGVATAWPFSVGQYGSSYGVPAARFPASAFATMAGSEYPGLGVSIPVANGVQFNNAGTWVYVLASAMTGGPSVDQSAQAMTGATQAESEQACAANNNCPTYFEQELVTYAKVAVVALAAFYTFKVVKAVT